jgi:hypothetical protein
VAAAEDETREEAAAVTWQVQGAAAALLDATPATGTV